MEHNAPHSSSAFEGYYSKFDFPSGAHLALVLCKVKNAKTKPNMLSFTYVPETSRPVFQKEVWADELEMIEESKHAFKIDIPGIGFVRWDADSTTEYRLEHSEFSLKATTTTRTPWSAVSNTPESLLVNLPLPLHWHVHSLASKCSVRLKISDYDLPSADMSGEAIVHQEKNWASSFPSAHMWLQARDGENYFCCAGGQILGMEAFLLGYRSEDLNVDFRPPFALRFAGLSPTMSYTSDWNDRTFELSVQGLWQKLVVKASAPKGTFFSLSSPFPEGHRENLLGQSFRAIFDITIYQRSWLGSWNQVRKTRFDNASLEFGGGYYPPAGSQERYH